MAETAGGPSTGLQGFVGLLGVLSVPIVGYSLLTLYQTGESSLATSAKPALTVALCRTAVVTPVRCC